MIRETEELLKPTATDRRKKTRNKMYRYIYDSQQPVSKQQLSLALSYSLPTVHQNIGELLDAKLIRIGEVQRSSGGRPPIGYRINESVRYAIGISVTSKYIRLLASDLKENEMCFRETELKEPIGDNIGQKISDALNRFMRDYNLDEQRLLGVGITFPGVIDREKGTITLSPTLRMKSILIEEISRGIPYPVFVDNDSTSAGAAEWLGLNDEKAKKAFAYLFLENGVGGAVFIDGKPYLGHNLRSGEFGHMCVDPNGLMCKCGKRGCLEAYLSAVRFTTDLKVTPEEFFTGVMLGNKEYGVIWDEVMDHLAIGINNLRMAFDCDVILGGFVSEKLSPYLPTLRKKVQALNTFGDDGSFIRLGRFPNRASMMGVAWHFTEEFIESI